MLKSKLGAEQKAITDILFGAPPRGAKC